MISCHQIRLTLGEYVTRNLFEAVVAKMLIRVDIYFNFVLFVWTVLISHVFLVAPHMIIARGE